jgi:hypothetical protein
MVHKWFTPGDGCGVYGGILRASCLACLEKRCEGYPAQAATAAIDQNAVATRDPRRNWPNRACEDVGIMLSDNDETSKILASGLIS